MDEDRTQRSLGVTMAVHTSLGDQFTGNQSDLLFMLVVQSCFLLQVSMLWCICSFVGKIF